MVVKLNNVNEIFSKVKEYCEENGYYYSNNIDYEECDMNQGDIGFHISHRDKSVIVQVTIKEKDETNSNDPFQNIKINLCFMVSKGSEEFCNMLGHDIISMLGEGEIIQEKPN